MDTSIDDSYRFLAACYLREQVKQLATELVGIRESLDVEHVHQARVASRRLRAGLAMFGDCFSDKMVDRWRDAIKRITTELGTARDCDVHIEKLTRQLTGLKKRPASRALARLLVDLERQREGCQPLVLHEIDCIERSGVLEEILHAAKEILADVGKISTRKIRKGKSGRGKPRKTPYSQLVFDRLGEKIQEHLTELQSYEDSLASSKKKKQHHEMRIAAKRLRYTMEIAAPVYHGRLDESIQTIKRLQIVLGDIHDCDIWYDKLGAFKRYQREQVIEAYGQKPAFDDLNKGFNYLRRQCKSRRKKRFRDLVKLWKTLKRQGKWDDLLKTLDKKPRRKRAGKKAKFHLCHGGSRCHLCKRRNTCKKLRAAIDSGMVSISPLEIKLPDATPIQTAAKKSTTKKMTASKKSPGKRSPRRSKTQPKKPLDSQ
ncbi:MAG: CHAD domain-containing protein [Pirellulales bacterium]|nr:CHAD domain-containing protein [Pirellulales bacterium]